MRYLVIREDGIIANTVSSTDVFGSQFDNECKIKARDPDPMITRAIERPGAQVKLYVIEPAGTSPTGRQVVSKPTTGGIDDWRKSKKSHGDPDSRLEHGDNACKQDEGA